MKDSFVFVVCLLAGCSRYTLPPLTMNHPATPEAISAPERPASKTLAYTVSDLPSRRTAPSVTLAQKTDHESHHGGGSTKTQTVVGQGKVIATVPNANQLVIEHGPIENFMGAMTMGYQVDPPSLLEGIQSGDQVRFTIDVQKKEIINIEKLND